MGFPLTNDTRYTREINPDSPREMGIHQKIGLKFKEETSECYTGT
jgi:hypothetical protein